MNKQAHKVAMALRELMKPKGGVVLDNSPKGLPGRVDNSDKGNDPGAFEQEGLSDPGIQNMVTGNGGGPVIGNNRVRTSRTQ